MKKIEKLKKGDKVAILSPSFAAPGMFPKMYELGIKRLVEVFGLVPVEYTTTAKLGAGVDERTNDLIAAFCDREIRGIIATIGGDDQVTYVQKIPADVLQNNPKPFFGFSDNTHLINWLWLNGVPSYYGGSIMTQYAMHGQMDDFTVEFLRHALFDEGEFELKSADYFNDVSLDWGDDENLVKLRERETNEGWYWDGTENAWGLSWGGCLESVDEILRHGQKFPQFTDFAGMVLFLETSEEIPSDGYVKRVLRALGERGLLKEVKAVLVGRPKAWYFDNQKDATEKKIYKEAQRKAVLEMVRKYNSVAPVVQNLDFGHTDPQIPLPVGKKITVDTKNRKILAEF